MELFLRRFILVSVTLYFVAIIIFKQNYNTFTYYINGLFIVGYLIYLFMKKETTFKINIIIYIYAAFVFIALMSSLYGIEFYNTAFRSLQLFLLLINMFFIYNIIYKFNAEYVFLIGILLGSLINYILILGMFTAPFEIIFPGGGNRYMGTLGNPNVLALVMLISIFSSITYLLKKTLNNSFFLYYQYINILLATYVIMLTVSKKGMLFGILLIFIFLLIQIKNPKQFFRLLIIVSIVIIMVLQYANIDFIPIIENILGRFNSFESQISSSSSGGSTAERKYLIEVGISLFQNHPLFGYGLGNFLFLNDLGLYAHNNYIELLVGTGLIGALIFYLMYYFLYKKILYVRNKNIKTILFVIIFIFLFMDMAVVSYSSKYIIYTLLFISILAEKNNLSKEKTNYD